MLTGDKNILKDHQLLFGKKVKKYEKVKIF
jgi:hypothetical protein